MKKQPEWKCTDPDTEQYGRHICNLIFEFKQKGVEPKLINVAEYELKEIEHIINAYGYTNLSGQNKSPSFKNITDLYRGETNWIIAECIFESEMLNS